jgi:hypothetical protein
VKIAIANEADVAHLDGIILPIWVWHPEGTPEIRIPDGELFTEGFAIIHGELTASEVEIRERKRGTYSHDKAIVMCMWWRRLGYSKA